MRTAATGWRRLSLTTPAAAVARPVRSDRPVARAGRRRAAGRAATGVVRPVSLGGAPARQVDGTTCGSAVLVMLAATGDPALAQWLETGELPHGPLPPEVPPGAAALPGAGQRLAAAQRHVQAATGTRALGPLPWPTALGTPPWTAAREARFPGVRYRPVPMDDTREDARHLLAAVHSATVSGVPVPLYTGGDLGQGLVAAVPRHVVLAVPPPAGASDRGPGAGRRVLHVYEPATATVRPVPLEELLDRDGPHPALGGWSHVCWVLLPRPVAATDATGHTGSTYPRPKEEP